MSKPRKAVSAAQSNTGIESNDHPNYDQLWVERFKQLKAFRRKRGHCNVPAGFAENPGLGSWVSYQRYLRKKGRLRPKRERRLDRIGFQWELRRRRLMRRDWKAMLAMLTSFKEQHGHCDVPHEWAENIELARWIRSMRGVWRAGSLDERRMGQLNRLGFVWEPTKHRWEKLYEAMDTYRRKHGDCNVPTEWPENPDLGRWVRLQRLRDRAGELSNDQREKLLEIGFSFVGSRSQHWERMCTALVEYQRKHGTCHISTLSEDHVQLAHWIRGQRLRRRAGRLSKKQVQRLDKLGFVWDFCENQWEEMFEELGRFKKTHGHCYVPCKWPENPKLANWVQTQRAYHRKKKMVEDKLRRLNEVGFSFDGRSTSQVVAVSVAADKRSTSRRKEMATSGNGYSRTSYASTVPS